MKVFYVEIENHKKILIEEKEKIYLLESLGYNFKDINDLIASGIDLLKLDLSKAKEVQQNYKILSPIEYPKQDIVCIGMNYLDHKDELELVSKEDFSKDVDTIYFSKRANKVLGDGDIIALNEKITSCLDYEIELGVIIGQDCKNVKADEATNYIFGFTIFNDLSARDLQTKYKQWYYGKSFDGSSVMGPCILINDGNFDYDNLKLSTKINGEIRQENSTKNMILSVSKMIEDLSKSMTLKKGTIIATGTPSGVGMAFDPPRFLKKNDEIVMEIENIGVLKNIVR
ncbi:MAG: fumarylacetoacetate hydrolase family protein [Anaerococcus hydrogenalis]|uniref:fumarylacetoacetate hydrolase family protein n=1 Tax=Anaerococcus hydrogenalis TaxID=33029 RepID=UPI0029002D91|nr:fumarylacetoacetate hydrolase family protein [Anaerococcus hydrogenalis]MDU2582613.1 fumarylacetoacetate hydrolase family protein [Anaerococcus hydrogenalis]